MSTEYAVVAEGLGRRYGATWALRDCSLSIPAGNAIHEWVHDGRHLLGYPCH